MHASELQVVVVLIEDPRLVDVSFADFRKLSVWVTHAKG
jgi:hypothetical protein